MSDIIIEILDETPINIEVVEWDNLGTDVLFTDLLDTPSEYTGQAGKRVKVNATEDWLEFVVDDDAVDSVFGRTGDVVAVASDYNASQVDNDSALPWTFVSDALNETIANDTVVDDNAFFYALAFW